MSKRLDRPVAACALLAAVAVGTSPAGAARDPRGPACPPKDTKTIDGGVAGRIYFRPSRELDRVFLCAYRTRRRVQVGWDDCTLSPGVGLTRFVRRTVALAVTSCHQGGTTSTIDIRRIRDGRLLRRLGTAPDVSLRTDGTTTTVEVSDLVLRSDGVAAWIARVSNAEGSPANVTEFQLRTSIHGRTSDLVANGADLEPGSLALAGTTLYWTQNGVPRSTPLPR